MHPAHQHRLHQLLVWNAAVRLSSAAGQVKGERRLVNSTTTITDQSTSCALPHLLTCLGIPLLHSGPPKSINTGKGLWSCFLLISVVRTARRVPLPFPFSLLDSFQVRTARGPSAVAPGGSAGSAPVLPPTSASPAKDKVVSFAAILGGAMVRRREVALVALSVPPLPSAASVAAKSSTSSACAFVRDGLYICSHSMHIHTALTLSLFTALLHFPDIPSFLFHPPTKNKNT